MEDDKKTSEDGIKALNSDIENYYEEKSRASDEDSSEVQEKPQKTIYDHIRLGLIIASCVIASIYDYSRFGFALLALAILFFTLGTFFMGAIKKFITEGDNCSLLFRASFFLRILLFVFFFFGLSMIFLTKRYDLNYSYWIAVISFLLIATIEVVESSVEDYRNRRNHSMLSKIFRILFNIFLFCLWINSISFIVRMSLPEDKSLLVIDQVETPDQLMIIKRDYGGLDRKGSNHIIPIIITEQSLLKQLAFELGNKSYTPMNSIATLNFSKLERMTKDCYQIFIIYKEQDDTNLFSSPFVSITMIDDKLVYREPNLPPSRWLFRNSINDYYDIELSEETISKLYDYINSSKN